MKSITASMILTLAIVGFLTLTQIGCVIPFAANLLHALGSDDIPAEFTGLEESTLAVVTVTDGSQYNDDASARQLSRMVSDLLRSQIKDLKLVREDQIAQWRDTNGWDSIDFVSIGRGVKADKVLAIELTNLRLQEGATLYRGRSDVTIKVIDTASSDVLYRKTFDEYTYPVSAGQYTSETTESRFRKLYFKMLSKQISRSFHPWDMTEDFASDSIIASQ